MGGEPRSKAQRKRERVALEASAERVGTTRSQGGLDSLVGVDRELLAVGSAVLRLLGGDGGWLRMVPDSDGLVWCKWRYTVGRWAGHYSLVVWKPTRGSLSQALEALENMVDGAHCNPPTHKPSKDVY